MGDLSPAGSVSRVVAAGSAGQRTRAVTTAAAAATKVIRSRRAFQSRCSTRGEGGRGTSTTLHATPLSCLRKPQVETKAHGWNGQLLSHRTSLHNVSTCQSLPTTPFRRVERATTAITFDQLSCRIHAVRIQPGQEQSNLPPQRQVFQHRKLSQFHLHGSHHHDPATWLSQGFPPTAPTMSATFPSLWKAGRSQYSTRISRGRKLINKQHHLWMHLYPSRQTITRREFKG